MFSFIYSDYLSLSNEQQATASAGIVLVLFYAILSTKKEKKPIQPCHSHFALALSMSVYAISCHGIEISRWYLIDFYCSNFQSNDIHMHFITNKWEKGGLGCRISSCCIDYGGRREKLKEKSKMPFSDNMSSWHVTTDFAFVFVCLFVFIFISSFRFALKRNSSIVSRQIPHIKL